uniref:Uncharacterized protein n=1 Tax=Sphaerodactylus townsendi TaxID=933632 RepID=A0ACB8GBZ7_9SAUR
MAGWPGKVLLLSVEKQACSQDSLCHCCGACWAGKQVQYVIQGYHKRREYIAAFLSHFGTGVVEYDAEGFTKLTLLLMWKDFCFLVHSE